MEVFVIVELLADLRGAVHLAVPHDHAAIGLGGEKHLCQACHGQGIDEAGDQGQSDQQEERRADLSQHGCSPQARCRAVTTRSMALMPINGMMIPQTPEISRLRRSSGPAPIARKATPFSASGISATMISALKMMADRIALCGVAKFMMLSDCSCG